MSVVVRVFVNSKKETGGYHTPPNSINTEVEMGIHYVSDNKDPNYIFAVLSGGYAIQAFDN